MMTKIQRYLISYDRRNNYVQLIPAPPEKLESVEEWTPGYHQDRTNYNVYDVVLYEDVKTIFSENSLLKKEVTKLKKRIAKLEKN